MKLYRILITAITASFRYPNFISSNQLSIKAIPYSTIAGLVASATGNEKNINFKFSYIFRYLSSYVDLETIYKFEKKGNSVSNSAIQDPTFQREILTDCYLTLYLDSQEIAQAFNSPIFQLLLGRSGDLARVVEVKEINLSKVNETLLNGTIVPYSQYKSSGQIYAMPKYFDYTDVIRQPQKVQPFLINDGKGSFKYQPKNKKEMFDMNNWKFKNLENKIKVESYFDEELSSHILLRDLC